MAELLKVVEVYAIERPVEFAVASSGTPQSITVEYHMTVRSIM